MIDRPNSGSDALKSVPDRLGDLVTIAMVPRDIFAWSNKVLDRLIDTTSDGVRIIVFDTGASGCPREYMEKRCKEADVTLLRSRGIATSSQARNKAIELVGTKYVAFVDNDTLVSDGWLEPLVKCAEDTGAWAVGPIICERLPEGTWLHGYDDELEIRESPDGERYYHDFHYNAHVKLADIRGKLKRMETPIVEFHAQLVRMDAYNELGGYDENIVNMYDYGDFLLRVQAHGKK